MGMGIATGRGIGMYVYFNIFLHTHACTYTFFVHTVE